jgi:hypothetical protein
MRLAAEWRADMSSTLPQPAPDDRLVHRVRAEFLEMPGLQLTCEQAQRLWVIDPQTCMSILERLVATRFLVRRTDGRYVRCGEGQPLRNDTLFSIKAGPHTVAESKVDAA